VLGRRRSRAILTTSAGGLSTTEKLETGNYWTPEYVQYRVVPARWWAVLIEKPFFRSLKRVEVV